MKESKETSTSVTPQKTARRRFLKAAATGSVALAAASSLAKPAISQGTMQWRMQTTWPKNFPGLGTGANKLAELIGSLSGGRLTVEVFGAGEIVPAFETMDAVSGGESSTLALKGSTEEEQFEEACTT